jgi:cell division protein FtsQ
MLPVFGEDIGRNIFFIPLAERRRQLEQIPWIERATVMRLLPDQIRISVVERQPVAFVRQGSQVGLVDANGVLLTMPAAMMAQRHYSFPVVTGITPQDPPAAARNRMAVYQRLLAELDANGQHLSEQISEIDLTDTEDARVLMPEQGTDILAHFGEDHFLERYQRYRAHIAEWRQQYPKLAAVDLRYDQQVVLEMAQGTDAPQTPPEGANAAGAKPPEGEPAPKTQAAPAPPAAPAKNLKAGAKPGAKTATKAKTSAARDKAARDRKKRAAERRIALDASRQKKSNPATAPSQGQ